jgi:hypothetical protein
VRFIASSTPELNWCSGLRRTLKLSLKNVCAKAARFEKAE